MFHRLPQPAKNLILTPKVAENQSGAGGQKSNGNGKAGREPAFRASTDPFDIRHRFRDIFSTKLQNHLNDRLSCRSFLRAGRRIGGTIARSG